VRLSKVDPSLVARFRPERDVQSWRLSTPSGGAMLKEVAMATLEERVAYLEGQVSEHTQTLIDIRDSIRQLERRFDVRLDTIDRRIEGLEDKLGRRVEGLEDKMSRQFSWLVGIQVTTLVAIVGALLARS
jgi:predicted  nucleic acid-binding Zn-ribbon protein